MLKRVMSVLLALALVITGISVDGHKTSAAAKLNYSLNTENLPKAVTGKDLLKYQRVSDGTVWISTDFTCEANIVGDRNNAIKVSGYDTNLLDVKVEGRVVKMFGKNFGETNILVTAGSATCLIPVKIVKRAKISFTKKIGEVGHYVLSSNSIGNKQTKIRFNTIEGTTESNGLVGTEWSSSNKSVVQVTQNSVDEATITAVSDGTATISCRAYDKVSAYNTYHYEDVYDGVICTMNVVVKGGVVVSVSEAKYGDIGGKTLNVSEGDSLKVTTKIEGANNVVWQYSSSNNKVATVDGNGNVKILSGGTARININGGGQSTYFNINATSVIREIKFIKGEDIEIYPDDTYQLTYTVTPNNDIDKKSISFESSDETIASVDNNGLVKAVKPGNVKIKVTCPTAQDEIEVKVVSQLKKVKFDKTVIKIGRNEVAEVGLSMEPSFVALKEVSITSSDTDIADIVEDNKVKGIKCGKTTLKAHVVDKKRNSASARVDVIVGLERPIITGKKFDGKKITITWGAVPDAKGYTVYKKVKGGFKKYKELGTTSFKDKKVKPGVTYNYKVMANHSKEECNSAKTDNISIKAKLKTPKIKKIKKHGSSYRVTIKGTKYTGFEIYYGKKKNTKSFIGSTKSKTVSIFPTLKKNKTYYFRVKSYTKVGKKIRRSSWSKVYKYKR